MRILLLYDNFIRDFRGLLLLKYLLIAKGHKIWMRATWNNPTNFAALLDIDVLIGGQVAEASTHHVGKFAKENNIRFVLNSTENVTVPEKFDLFVTYNTTELNDDIIDLQSIAAKDIYDYILNHPGIKPINKKKYKYLGFPRLDLTINESFRKIELTEFREKYGLPSGGKVYIFISSFLLEGAFEGIPQRDLDKWNYTAFKKRTNDLLPLTTTILTRLVDEILLENDVLLIKKHPWDCSSYFKDNFGSKKSIVLDNNDYILPCIANADVMLHTFSTSAIEAWILNKRTISIMQQEHKDSYSFNHMRHELSVSSFEELKVLLDNYPSENPSKKSLDIFYPNLDGHATERLVEEICKLTPYPKKRRAPLSLPLKSKVVTEFWKWIHIARSPVKKIRFLALSREWLIDNGFFKFNVAKYALPNTKAFDFYSWENDRAVIIKKYSKHFRKYSSDYIKRIK